MGTVPYKCLALRPPILYGSTWKPCDGTVHFTTNLWAECDECGRVVNPWPRLNIIY